MSDCHIKPDVLAIAFHGLDERMLDAEVSSQAVGEPQRERHRIARDLVHERVRGIGDVADESRSEMLLDGLRSERTRGKRRTSCRFAAEGCR